LKQGLATSADPEAVRHDRISTVIGQRSCDACRRSRPNTTSLWNRTRLISVQPRAT
jgi:hypothetical protein